MTDKHKTTAQLTVNSIPEDFPLSRMLHCHNVGLRMYSYAKRRLGWDETKCQEMYLLGMLHDIGYELDSDSYGHDEAIARILNIDGYVYAEEIRLHSYPQTECDSPEMQLLCFADATVDGVGNWTTFDERRADLAERHGADSQIYKEAVEIAEWLKSLGFDDEIKDGDFIRISPNAEQK